MEKMRILRTSWAAILASAIILAMNSPGIAVEWQDVEIGMPAAAGRHTEANGLLTVTGAGKGSTSKSDQLHYTYTSLPAGDVEVIARIVSLHGEPGSASAGIMLRAADSPDAVEAHVGFGLRRKAARKRTAGTVIRRPYRCSTAAATTPRCSCPSGCD